MASNPDDIKASVSSPRAELTIIAGLHTGATFALNEDMLLIGADGACDIWLSDAGLAPHHAALMSDGRGGVAIRPLDGAVSIDGQPVPTASRIPLTAGSVVLLGESGVRLRLGGQVDGAAAPDAHTQAIAGSGLGRPANKPSSKQKPVRTRAATASLIIVAGLLAAAFATHKLRPATAATSSTSQAGANSVATDAELIDQVRDVFRASGYDAEVTTLQGNGIRIENLDGQNQRVRRAADQVRADIPQLKSLTFASPDTTEPPAEPPFYENEPAGHLSVSVDGETAYLIAANGGRYFTGSVLPGGYTIRRITSRAVQVDRDGQISWLRF